MTMIYIPVPLSQLYSGIPAFTEAWSFSPQPIKEPVNVENFLKDNKEKITVNAKQQPFFLTESEALKSCTHKVTEPLFLISLEVQDLNNISNGELISMRPLENGEYHGTITRAVVFDNNHDLGYKYRHETCNKVLLPLHTTYNFKDEKIIYTPKYFSIQAARIVLNNLIKDRPLFSIDYDSRVSSLSNALQTGNIEGIEAALMVNRFGISSKKASTYTAYLSEVQNLTTALSKADVPEEEVLISEIPQLSDRMSLN